MALVSDIIPALIGGVSQQPASARAPGKAEIGRNVIASLFDGTDKRPPTEYVARLFDYDISTPAADKPLIRFVNRDEFTRYMVWIQDAAIRVFDLADGTEKTVTMETDTEDYIDTDNSRRDLELTTVGDTHFVLNRAVTVENGTDESPTAVYEALIYVRSGTYARKYTVTVNGVEHFYHTPDGSTDWNVAATDAALIADVLCHGASASPEVSLPPSWYASGDYSAISVGALDSLSGFTIARRGSVIKLSRATDFDISVDDSQGGAAMSIAKGVVSKLGDLPSKAFDGFLVRVGKTSSETDTDHFLRFDDPDDDGTGVWTETLGPGVNLGVDAATLPHRLVFNDDDTFTFEQCPYVARACGTDVSAADPTFVGRNIHAVSYLFDRVGFWSGEDCHFSAARDLFRYYRISAMTKAEDDPFAITASADGVSIIRHCVTVGGAVAAFSAQRQFGLERTSERFAALGAQLVETQNYEASTTCKPAVAGASAYFTLDRQGYATFREYRPQSAVTATVSDEIGFEVPRFVPAGVHTLAATAIEQTLAAVTDATSNTLYVYRWADIDGRRLMSAWSDWDIAEDFNIVGADFIGSQLYLALDRPDHGVDLEVINLAPAIADTGATYKCRLDGLLSNADTSESYNAGTDRTTITLPYDPTDLDLQVVSRASLDEPLTDRPIVARTSNSVSVSGDIDGDTFFVGRPYRFHWRFSPFFVRESKGSQTGAPILDGRLQIADVSLEMVAPYFIRTEVTNEGRSAFVKEFMSLSGDLLASETDTSKRIHSSCRFAVAAQNTRTTIDLYNDTHLPCQTMSAHWRGQFNQRTRGV